MLGSVSLKTLCYFLLFSGFFCLLPDSVLFVWNALNEMGFCMERTNLLNCHEILACSIMHHCFDLRPKLFWCLFPKMHPMCVSSSPYKKGFYLLCLCFCLFCLFIWLISGLRLPIVGWWFCLFCQSLFWNLFLFLGLVCALLCTCIWLCGGWTHFTCLWIIAWTDSNYFRLLSFLICFLGTCCVTWGFALFWPCFDSLGWFFPCVWMRVWPLWWWTISVCSRNLRLFLGKVNFLRVKFSIWKLCEQHQQALSLR